MLLKKAFSSNIDEKAFSRKNKRFFEEARGK